MVRFYVHGPVRATVPNRTSLTAAYFDLDDVTQSLCKFGAPCHCPMRSVPKIPAKQKQLSKVPDPTEQNVMFASKWHSIMFKQSWGEGVWTEILRPTAEGTEQAVYGDAVILPQRRLWLFGIFMFM